MRTGFRLQVLGYSLIFFLLSTVHFPFGSPLYPAYAADSTPSADIKSKLEELKKEIASRAAKLKQEVNKKLKDKAYIGKVKTKSENAITLATKNGPKIVNISVDTEFVSKIKAKKYSQKLMSEEDYLVSLGDVDEQGVLTAKRIILLPPPTQTDKTFLWGQIISISDKLSTLKDKNHKNVAITFTNPASVKILDFVILTGFIGKNEIFEAEFAYVIPQGASFKPKKIATPSAQPSKPSLKTVYPSTKPSSR